MYPFTRSYQTKLQTDECLMFLRRKNVYDPFLFSFEEAEEGYRITFLQAVDPLSPYGSRLLKNSLYAIAFERGKEETRFTVSFLSTDRVLFDGPQLPENKLDEFFRVKLDAEAIPNQIRYKKVSR